MSKVTQNCFVYNKLFSCPTYPLWRSLNVSHLRVIFLEIKLKANDSFSSQETTNLIKMMVFIWNCRLCEWTQYIDFLGVIHIIVPVTNAQSGSVVLNIRLPPLPFWTLTLHQWERALKLWTADTENTAAETLQRSVQVAVLNQCVRIMSRCITVRNHISIRIIKKSRCTAKCTLSSVSLPLYEKALCLSVCAALFCHWLTATFRTKQMIAKKG